MTDIEIFKLIQDCLQKNQPVFLLIVIENQGSSPGRTGFKLAVSENAQAGTVGGGVMEHNLIHRARQMLKKNTSGVFLKQMVQNDSLPDMGSGMICAGRQSVAGCPLGVQNLSLITELVEALSNKNYGILHVSPSGVHFTSGQQGRNSFVQDGDQWQYEENIGISDQVSIIGGGHVALALSRLLATLDFHITLYDERADLETMAVNTFAHRKMNCSFRQVGEYIPEGKHQYVVIMTPSHATDAHVLRQLINKRLRYLGMMGSRSKAREIFARLQADGISPEKLQNVHCPIGLPIKSRTAAEIAVSIAAEIIKTKNSVQRSHQQQNDRPETLPIMLRAAAARNTKKQSL